MTKKAKEIDWLRKELDWRYRDSDGGCGTDSKVLRLHRRLRALVLCRRR